MAAAWQRPGRLVAACNTSRIVTTASRLSEAASWYLHMSVGQTSVLLFEANQSAGHLTCRLR